MTPPAKSSSPKPLRWLLGCTRPARQWIALSVGLGIAGGMIMIVQARCMARIIHATVVEGAHRDDLLPLFARLLILVGARAVLGWARESAGFQAGARIREEVRMALVAHITRLGPAVISRWKTGALASTVMEQVEGLHGFFAHYLPQLVLSAAIPAAMLAVVFPISWAAGTILLFTAPLIPLFMILVGMGAESISQRHFQALARMSAHFFDRLQGLGTLKLLDRSRGEEKEVARVTDGYRRKTMSVLKVAFLSAAVLEFFSSISIALVAMYLGMRYLGYLEFGSWGTPLTLGAGFFILLIAPDFYLHLRELGTHYHARAEALGAAREILDILSTEAHHVSGTARPLPPTDRLRICCEDLHLTYNTERRPAVMGVSFDLNPDEQVVLVGASGAGKTSVVNLLLGFVQPDKGCITVNGTPLTRIAPESWRRHIAWIGQNPVLLHGTISENIRMGRPEASAADIDAAARSAGVLEFSTKLPDGLATRVGEQGYGLSRGQAQRIALARAFVKAAPLLILDEPAAGLDMETEAQVMAAVKELSAGRTVLLITHRLQGLDRTDRVLVMADGRIVQAGTWSELQHGEGELHRLLKRQKEGRQHG